MVQFQQPVLLSNSDALAIVTPDEAPPLRLMRLMSQKRGAKPVRPKPKLAVSLYLLDGT